MGERGSQGEEEEEGEGGGGGGGGGGGERGSRHQELQIAPQANESHGGLEERGKYGLGSGAKTKAD